MITFTLRLEKHVFSTTHCRWIFNKLQLTIKDFPLIQKYVTTNEYFIMFKQPSTEVKNRCYFCKKPRSDVSPRLWNSPRNANCGTNVIGTLEAAQVVGRPRLHSLLLGCNWYKETVNFASVSTVRKLHEGHVRFMVSSCDRFVCQFVYFVYAASNIDSMWLVSYTA